MSLRLNHLILSLGGFVCAAALALSCTPIDNPGNRDASPIPDAAPIIDSSSVACVPEEDSDNDCMLDSLEGCNTEPAPDRDGDQIPDYFDLDSDADGLADRDEVGTDCTAPRDTDEDQIPDYIDTDSDDDGALDKYEDRNGDGVLGECMTPCSDISACNIEARETCAISALTGTGVCISLECLNGETDPYTSDTDSDGIRDGLEGTYICSPTSEDNPNGLKTIKYADSSDTMYGGALGANWRIGLMPEALEGVPIIVDPDRRDSAFIFDLSNSEIEVAGFLVTRPSAFFSAQDELQEAIEAIDDISLRQNFATRITGTPGTSLDRFDTVVGTILDLQTRQNVDAAAVRNALLPALLDRRSGEVAMPPIAWSGVPATQFTIVMQTVYRLEPGQTLFMGAVARRVMYDDRTKKTSLYANDFGNGTNNTLSGNEEATECEQFMADQQATADIIWVVDESGSTLDWRTNIAEAAAEFFEQALSAGLDFRMGVTDMNGITSGQIDGPGGQPGIFASRQEGGTGDRWVLPDEPAVFSENVQDPSGINPPDGGNEHGLTAAMNAIERHLPRDDNDPQKIRENAKLVVLYVTDEKPDEIEDLTSVNDGDACPSPSQQAEVKLALGMYVTHLLNNNAAAHLIGEPKPCGTTLDCGLDAEPAIGYSELVTATAGQAGSLCQFDFGPTITAIIDAIAAEASPIALRYYPISSSVTVVRDNVFVDRSRDVGWDYRGASNSIVFFRMPIDPANPVELVVSYRRWAIQLDPG